MAGLNKRPAAAGKRARLLEEQEEEEPGQQEQEEASDEEDAPGLPVPAIGMEEQQQQPACPASCKKPEAKKPKTKQQQPKIKQPEQKQSEQKWAMMHYANKGGAYAIRRVNGKQLGQFLAHRLGCDQVTLQSVVRKALESLRQGAIREDEIHSFVESHAQMA